MSSRRDVFILRGIPGAGKSTIAQILLKGTINQERSAYCSADTYFTDQYGNYNFSREHLGDAHAKCQSNFRNALFNEIEVIVVDNTNVRRKDFAGYIQAAENAKYRVFEITVGNFNVDISHARNSHNVPLEAIAAMAQRFER